MAAEIRRVPPEPSADPARPSAMNPPRPTARRRRPSYAAAPALLLVLGIGLAPVLAGCSSGGSGGAESGAASVTGDAPATQDLSAADRLTGGTAQTAARVETRSLISRGTVSLQATDVAAAKLDVQRVVDRLGGEVADERTDTDGHGRVQDTHLVLRVPAASFRDAMAALAQVADLTSSSASSQDVTTRVIDTRTRLRVQRRSIARITTLLARAQDLRDIVLIEGQLSRRQAALDSLERQSAWLADQTSLSTVTVDIHRRSTASPHHTDRTGFLAGLSAGWHGLSAVAVGAATALGAALPFAVVLVALLGLAWPLARRLRRQADRPLDRGRTPPPSPAA